ncbi:hypothetical protein FOZ61_004096 [Perkinsus olseni]|uniref:WD repeat domain 90 n=1 Tax=Perkinsus olseni TaxID=32597 RepID=A0A7J6LN31_PEROL|nr:hypothetical protein FOZ61_004096 [Perkinsus olseni]
MSLPNDLLDHRQAAGDRSHAGLPQNIRRRIVTRYDLIDVLEEFDMHRLEAILKTGNSGRDLSFWCKAFEEILEPPTAQELAQLKLAVADLLADIFLSEKEPNKIEFNHERTEDGVEGFELDWKTFTEYLLGRAKESDRAREGRENLRMRGLSIPRCPATAVPISIDHCRHYGRILSFHSLPLRPAKSGPYANVDFIVSAEEDATSIRVWTSRRKDTAIQWVADLLLPRPGLRATHTASDGMEGRQSATFVTALLTDGNIGIWDLEGLYKNLSSDHQLRSRMWRFPCREVISMSRLEGSGWDVASSCEGLWYSQLLERFVVAHAQTHSLRAFKLTSSRKSGSRAPPSEDFTRPVTDPASSTVHITLGVCMLGCHDARVTAITDIPHSTSSSSLDLSDSRLMASVAADATVGVWDLRTGYQVHRFTIPNYGGSRPQLRSIAYGAAVDRLVIAGSSCLVYVVQPVPPPGSASLGQSVIRRLVGHKTPLTSVATPPGASSCAISCDEWGEMRIWNLRKLECVQVIKSATSGLKCCGAEKMSFRGGTAEGAVRLLLCSTKFGRVDLFHSKRPTGASRRPVAVVISLLRSTITVAEPSKVRVHSLSNAELITEIMAREIGEPTEVVDDRTISTISLTEDHGELMVGFSDGSLAIQLMSMNGRHPQPAEAHSNLPVTDIRHSAARAMIISLSSQDGVCLVHADRPGRKHTNRQAWFLPLIRRVEPPCAIPQSERKINYALNTLRGLLASVVSGEEGRVSLWSVDETTGLASTISTQGVLTNDRRVMVEAVAFLEPFLLLIVLTREHLEVPDPTADDNTVIHDAQAGKVTMTIARFRVKVYVGSNVAPHWTPIIDRADKKVEHHFDIPLTDIEPPIRGSSSTVKLLMRMNDMEGDLHENAVRRDLLFKCGDATRELIENIFEARGREPLRAMCEVATKLTCGDPNKDGGPVQRDARKAKPPADGNQTTAVTDRVDVSGLVVAEIAGRKVMTFELHLEGDRSVLEGNYAKPSRHRPSFSSIGRSVTVSCAAVSEFSLSASSVDDGSVTSPILQASTNPELVTLLVATRHGFDLLRLSDGAVIRRHIEPFGAPFPFDAPIVARMINSVASNDSEGYVEEENHDGRRRLEAAFYHAALSAELAVEDSLPSRNTLEMTARTAKRSDASHARAATAEKLTPRTLQGTTFLDYFTWSPTMPPSGHLTPSASDEVQGGTKSHLDRIGIAIDKTIEDFAWNRRRVKEKSQRGKRRAFSETNLLERPDILARAKLTTACARGELFSAAGSRPSRETRTGARRLKNILSPKLAVLTASRVLAVAATDMSDEGVNVSTEDDFEALYRTCLSRQSGYSRSKHRRTPKSLPPIVK